jgi:rod shape-determining protein MreD
MSAPAPWRQMESHERVRELTRGWQMLIPSFTIGAALLLVAVVPLVTTLPVLPDIGLALLIAWRLYRPDMLAPWAGLPLGILADILTAQPLGVSATVWPLVLLGLAMIEPRFPLRDQRVDWMLATAAITLGKLIIYEGLVLTHLPQPFLPFLMGVASTIFFFPIIARLAAWMERQWLAAG